MPMPAPHRNQSLNLQSKSVEWFQHNKSTDLKKANSNKISQPLHVSTATPVQSSVECWTEVIVMSLNKQLMATRYKYSNINNNK